MSLQSTAAFDSRKMARTNYSHRCPKGNRQMRRVLNQAANAAVKAKGTIVAIVYRRFVPDSDTPKRSAQSPTGCVV